MSEIPIDEVDPYEFIRLLLVIYPPAKPITGMFLFHITIFFNF